VPSSSSYSPRYADNKPYFSIVSSRSPPRFEAEIFRKTILSKVREAIAIARNHGVDAILSVGGGSVLDSAKAIAAGVRHKGDVWDLFKPCYIKNSRMWIALALGVVLLIITGPAPA
jgi:alcohol dehydrogenase YqhD (iron-dependent ADH family)